MVMQIKLIVVVVVAKILGKFSRLRPSLTLEDAKRLYKAMVLPILDCCVLCGMNADKETVTRLNDCKDEQRGSST